MARKKPGTPRRPEPAGHDRRRRHAGDLRRGFLAQPASRAQEVRLKLSHAERALLVGVPELRREVEGAARHPLDRHEVVRFTMDELARICLALSEALLDAEGRDAVKMLKVTGKVTDLLDQAIAEVEKPAKPRRAAPKAGKSRRSRRRPGPRAGLPTEGHAQGHQAADLAAGARPRLLAGPGCTRSSRRRWAGRTTTCTTSRSGAERYTDPRGMDDLDMEDAGKVKLGQVAPKGKAKLRYTYDFGDNWQHEVLVEKVLPPEEGRNTRCASPASGPARPRIAAGRGATWSSPRPSEDPGHERHEEFLEWRGEFDPEAFDPDAVNKELRPLR